MFKQRVSPEDMFLGIAPLRHGGTGCSAALVLKVELPETKLAEIDLDVKPMVARLQTPRFRLRAHLPEQVDDKSGDAKWDAAKHVLTVTLPIVREGFAQASRADDLD